MKQNRYLKFNYYCCLNMYFSLHEWNEVNFEFNEHPSTNIYIVVGFLTVNQLKSKASEFQER